MPSFRKGRVEHLENQLKRNDDDFTAKYREFKSKIDELDVMNRNYREAIQKLELRISSPHIIEHQVKTIVFLTFLCFFSKNQ